MTCGPQICALREEAQKSCLNRATSLLPFPFPISRESCYSGRVWHTGGSTCTTHPPDLSKSKFIRLWTLAAWTGAKITAKLQSCSDSDRSLRGDRSLRAGSSSNRKRGKEEAWPPLENRTRRLSSTFGLLQLLLATFPPSPKSWVAPTHVKCCQERFHACVGCKLTFCRQFKLQRREENSMIMPYLCEWQLGDRVEICRDRRDRQSCKICASCVIFSRKQCVSL